ncbi:MAG TPA: alcohol dehydrogenase catalytic domain-containing protein [Anaeromyxobacter sp.]|nr:alcohol dehydrogenase catalytic domain-containing protein [Anaeromyxobacter sp.]
MTSPGKIEFHEVPVPALAQGQVLVRMKRIGVCGSDIHVFHGKHALTPYPVVQGHEVSGVIEKVGPGVTGFSPGQAVTFQPQVTCGTCYPCTHGDYHICDHLKVMGFQTTGAASELFAVDAKKVLRLPPGMSLEHGAMMEPLAVGVHALKRGGGSKGRKVLVLGAGPIGNLVAQAARGLGATDVLITDLSDYRLELAARCGISGGVNPAKADLSESVRRRFGEGKADLILECVGAQKTMEQAVAVARKGTDIIVVGVFGDKPVVDMGTVQDRELRLIGTLMYQEPDWKDAIALVEGGKVNLEPLVTDRYPFDRYLEAYKYIDANREKAMKVMITVEP